MPKGKGRPYNKDEKTIAKAQKKLRNITKNKSIKDDEGGKTRGNIMGLSRPANYASESYRAYSRDFDKLKAKEIRKKKKRKYDDMGLGWKEYD